VEELAELPELSSVTLDEVSFPVLDWILWSQTLNFVLHLSVLLALFVVLLFVRDSFPSLCLKSGFWKLQIRALTPKSGVFEGGDSFFHVGKGLLIPGEAYVALTASATSPTLVMNLVDQVIDLIWPGRTFLGFMPPEGMLKEKDNISGFHRVRMELAASFLVFLTSLFLKNIMRMSVERAKEIVMVKVRLKHFCFFLLHFKLFYLIFIQFIRAVTQFVTFPKND